jgi:hypothetical protein
VSYAALAAQLTNDAVIYAAAASAGFLVFMIALDPKLLRTPIGKTLGLLDAGLLALYVPAILHRFFGLQITQVGFAWYYLGTLLLVGTAVWWRTIILICAQLHGKTGRPS